MHYVTASCHKTLLVVLECVCFELAAHFTVMDSMNVVGPNVQKARLSKKPKISQEQLAAKLQTLGWDIDRFGVSKIERCAHQVTDKQLLLLAKALSISPAQLLEV
ncbi:MAG: hypothetical protein WCF84_23455 [Anaerolineae bacterium]